MTNPATTRDFQPGDMVWIGTVGKVVDDPDTPQGAVAVTYGDADTQVWYVSPQRLELIERAEEVAP